jgi:hypothetical protein
MGRLFSSGNMASIFGRSKGKTSRKLISSRLPWAHREAGRIFDQGRLDKNFREVYLDNTLNGNNKIELTSLNTRSIVNPTIRNGRSNSQIKG